MLKRALGDFQIVVQMAHGGDHLVDHLPHQRDQCQRLFREVDFPAEQGEPCSVAFRLMDQFERVPRRAGAASENHRDHDRP